MNLNAAPGRTVRFAEGDIRKIEVQVVGHRLRLVVHDTEADEPLIQGDLSAVESTAVIRMLSAAVATVTFSDEESRRR